MKTAFILGNKAAPEMRQLWTSPVGLNWFEDIHTVNQQVLVAIKFCDLHIV